VGLIHSVSTSNSVPSLSLSLCFNCLDSKPNKLCYVLLQLPSPHYSITKSNSYFDFQPKGIESRGCHGFSYKGKKEKGCQLVPFSCLFVCLPHLATHAQSGPNPNLFIFSPLSLQFITITNQPIFFHRKARAIF